MGGVAGLAATMGGATEFQKKNIPHLHACAHLANTYQHRTCSVLSGRVIWTAAKGIQRGSAGVSKSILFIWTGDLDGRQRYPER